MKFFNKKSHLSNHQTQSGMRLTGILKNVLFICLFVSLYSSIVAQSDQSAIGIDKDQREECTMTVPPAELQKIIARDLKRSQAGNSTAKSTTRIVPVKIHIIRRSNGTGGLSVASALADIAQANTRYASAKFKFIQCGSVNYIDKDAFFTNLTKGYNASAEEYDMAVPNRVADALNVFYCPNTSTGSSWSSFPYYLSSYGKDWMVMKNSQSNNGSTFSHEAGHYFDLYHTHQGSENVTRNSGSSCYNCTTGGDLLCDTPADKGSNFTSSCGYNGTAVNSCDGLAYAPSPTNIMSYANKPCRTTFTAGQINRMQLAYDNDRTAIHNSSCVCPEPTTTQNYTNSITSNFARLNCSASGTYRDFQYRASTTSTWTNLLHTS